MLIASVKEKAQFGPDHFQAVPIARTANSMTMVIGLEAGQAIPVHHPHSDVTITILEGEVTLVSGDEDLEHAGPGAVLLAPAGSARGMRASKKTIAIAVASPPPGPDDHKEVAEHFAKGTWR